MRFNNKLLLIGAVVLLLFVALYQLIKSSMPVEIEVTSLESQQIHGVYFEGDWKDEQLQSYFLRADSLARVIDGISSAVYYNDPEEDDGFMKVFIGVNTESAISDPVFEEIRELEAGSFLKGRISNNYFQVPQGIYAEMKDYAEEQSMEIGEFSVEQYFSDTLMIVYLPIVKE
jgi:effector-binding domain-containing protein